MRFTRIELENVFAYDGIVPFVFPDEGPDKNIVLIWGRNGMGKTSFLKALKLLFLGITPEKVRRVGVPPRILTERQYVVGDGAGWSGLINRQASRRAERDAVPPSARVSASWELPDGKTVTIERRWTARPASFDENAVVYDGLDRLAGAAAEDRIADFMPPEFVDYFFFDGEDIKSLAETESIKQADIDRLLRITFITELASELDRLGSDRRRRDMGEELLRDFSGTEADLVKSRGEKASIRHALSSIEESLTTDGAILQRLAVRRENLSTGASDAQRSEMEDRRAFLRLEVEEATDRIAGNLPSTAPIVANLALVRSALAATEERVRSSSDAEQRYLQQVAGRLPAWLMEDASLQPPAAQTVADRLVARMRRELPSGSGGPFASLDALRAERLNAMLSRWATAGDDILRAQVSELSALRRAQRELVEVEEALMQIEVGSQANLDQYRTIIREIAELEERQRERAVRKGQLLEKLIEIEQRIVELSGRLAILGASQERAERERDEARFIQRVGRALNELSESLRQAVRERLQERLNARFHELVTMHPLVERVTIDEGYTMTYLDAQGRQVGRSSLSSGLKQLSATALLWSLKDVSDIDMPVVIDTPLGRIDRENQDNMLNVYYPHLARQVIILPTNTEIDLRRFELIRERVGVQYRIVNESGDSARAEPGGSLVQA